MVRFCLFNMVLSLLGVDLQILGWILAIGASFSGWCSNGFQMVTVGGGFWSSIGFAPIWAFLASFFWFSFGLFYQFCTCLAHFVVFNEIH